jgi:hypothetical protein
VGVETVKKTDEVINENESQEQILSKVSEIKDHIIRVYDELDNNDKTVEKFEDDAIDQIRRIKDYYVELWKRGAFVDEQTQRKKDLHEVSRTILEEMDMRNMTLWSKRLVQIALTDDYKRAWRKPIVDNDGKPKDFALLGIDKEVETIFDEHMKAINLVRNFDYNELPKSLRLSIAEHVYKLYRAHDREWQKHGLTVVKHEDGLNIPDPFSGIIRVEEGEAYEGELYDAIVSHKKTIGAFAKKVKTGILDKNGKRIISLQREHELAMGVKVLDGYFKPHANYKWKRDAYRWAGLLLTKFRLKSKSGAEKFSRQPVSSEFYDFKDMFKEDPQRGLTREEIAKMQQRLCVFFMQFIRHQPGLLAMADIFAEVSEEKRAAHSIKMNLKLSDRA